MNEEEILATKAGIELDTLITTEFFPGDYHEYSTNISAAWRVVEKMRDYYPIIRFNQYSQKWEVEFLLGILVLTDSVEEAICKAALLARLGEK